ncbi:thiamine phosphate synthase [Desertivirga arenae]|uniref:thiamine phosphate synthase n=1 Tax=Desertivirga arenae TaxID=2810309 RepID=UPI001A975975|nr:thiamine phosphate synthase [Pedobacter sp. SYSU D00823]
MINRLHYISQQQDEISHLDAITNALEGGCEWIQLRVKNQPEDIVKSYAIEAKKLCDRYNAKLIINDFPDVAKAVKADGVHLGLLDMPVAKAREIVGPEVIIGGTANTFEDVLLRVSEGADYVGLGPFRFTKTKDKLSPILGIEGYRKILTKIQESNISIPVIAIGGIELEDVSSIMDTGVFGVAISGAITLAKDQRKVVEELYSKLTLSHQL